MKKSIIILFLACAQSLFSQETVTFIYVDNSISINRSSKLSVNVRDVIHSIPLPPTIFLLDEF